MSLQSRKLLLGAALSLIAGLETVSPVWAATSVKQPNQYFISQAGAPQRFDPIVPTADVGVRGRIVKIDGDQVQVRRQDGQLTTYTIPEFDQRRFELATGSEVSLIVRSSDQAVMAIRNLSNASALGNSDHISVSEVEVRGRIVQIDGDQVQVRRQDGQLTTYTIPEFDQRRFELAVGSEVSLIVRASDRAVTAIRNLSNASALGNSDHISVSDVEVRGRIVQIGGDQVQVRRQDGQLTTYTIPEFDQRRFELAVGSEVSLIVRASDRAVTAIRNLSNATASGNSDHISVSEVEVHGRVVQIDGDRVQVRRQDGQLTTYTIPESDQRHVGLVKGSDVALIVRATDHSVVAISSTTPHRR